MMQNLLRWRYAFAGVLLGLLIWIERGNLLLPSTLPALKWVGIKRLLRGEGFNAIFYGRWIPQYIKTVTFLAKYSGPGFKKWIQNTYHGKVLTHELARAIITIEKDVPLTDLGKKVLPYDRARDVMINAKNLDFVLTSCGCKAGMHEPCKVAKPPYQTCILIGEPVLTSFLLDHQPDVSRRVSREEALQQLDDFHAQGLVHNAWFKECIRDQFYVICNCCSCCCLGFNMMNTFGISQITSSGYAARLDKDLCRGCGVCVEVCQFKANALKDGKSDIKWEACFGCGQCSSKCPSGARSLVLDEGKGLPFDVRSLTH
jgi:NAD-dependent dihydropyrimidine dehydrogenase PreA subunit